jgi:hypothetical protein
VLDVKQQIRRELHPQLRELYLHHPTLEPLTKPVSSPLGESAFHSRRASGGDCALKELKGAA